MTVRIRPGTRRTPIRIAANGHAKDGSRRASVSIQPNRPFWQRAGWQQSEEEEGVVYRGRFRIWDKPGATFRHYPGRIETGYGNSRIFVSNPPETLIKEHPARWCFSHLGDGWYQMHWRRGTGDIDLSLAYLEKLLDEALNGWGRRRC